MKSKKITAIGMTLAIFPLTYFISFPIAGAILLSVSCAGFSLFFSSFTLGFITFFPLYLLRLGADGIYLTYNTLFIVAESVVGISNVYPNMLVYCTFFAVLVNGFSLYFGARALLKKTAFIKRLGA